MIVQYLFWFVLLGAAEYQYVETQDIPIRSVKELAGQYLFEEHLSIDVTKAGLVFRTSNPSVNHQIVPSDDQVNFPAHDGWFRTNFYIGGTLLKIYGKVMVKGKTTLYSFNQICGREYGTLLKIYGRVMM